jgi:hypothetical protein
MARASSVELRSPPPHNHLHDNGQQLSCRQHDGFFDHHGQSGLSPRRALPTQPRSGVCCRGAITPDAPVTNSTIPTGSTYSVSPGLPSGLSMDPSTGIVSGTPTAVPSTIVPLPPPALYPPPPFTATYTVTATSTTGSTTAPLTITLYNAPQAIPNMAQSITPLASGFQLPISGYRHGGDRFI